MLFYMRQFDESRYREQQEPFIIDDKGIFEGGRGLTKNSNVNVPRAGNFGLGKM